MWRFIGGSISPQIAVNASWAYAKVTFEIAAFFLHDFQINNLEVNTASQCSGRHFLCG
jgi:hypothetical protein